MHIKYNLSHYFPIILLLLLSCSDQNEDERDIINDPYTQEQAEIQAVVRSIAKDAEGANIKGLQAIHLDSEKFSKFGPRQFDRQDVANTNMSEAAHFGSITNFKQEVRDLKIDVFGEIGIATYYPHVSFLKDGKEIKADGRQTLVFIKTADGWKIIHEHGTIRKD